MAFPLFRRAAGPAPVRPPVAAPAAPSTAAPAQKAAGGRPALLAFHGTGPAAWTPRDRVSLIRAGFERNVVGLRAVRMIAEAAAAIPLVLSEGGRRLDDHPVLRLLAQPAAGQDGPGFLEAVYGHLLLTGNAFVEAVDGDGPQSGLPRALHALRPDRMRVIPGKDGWPVAYEYRTGERRYHWPITAEHSPVLHLKTFNPLDDHYGLSPLLAAAGAVDVHEAATRWTKALLDNAARPSGAIVFQGAEGHLSEEQYQRLSREIEDNHQGARNAGRPMLLEGGLDWRPMGFSPQDMGVAETRNQAARDIALAFGVPPMLLGLPGDNTYANYQEANRAFYRQTVLPLVRRAAAALACWLGEAQAAAGLGAGPLALRPDLDHVPALAAERDAQWRRVARADFLDEDEKRALLGFGPRRPA